MVQSMGGAVSLTVHTSSPENAARVATRYPTQSGCFVVVTAVDQPAGRTVVDLDFHTSYKQSSVL